MTENETPGQRIAKDTLRIERLLPGNIEQVWGCLLGAEVIANVAGGWHSHLAILADRLAGIEPRPFWTLFESVESDYQLRF